MDANHGPYNNSRHSAGRGDHSMFSRTADRTHWWNVTDWVPRGGRRF